MSCTPSATPTTTAHSGHHHATTSVATTTTWSGPRSPTSVRSPATSLIWEIGEGQFVGHPVGGQISLSDLATILGGSLTDQGVTALLRPLEDKSFIRTVVEGIVSFCDLAIPLR